MVRGFTNWQSPSILMQIAQVVGDLVNVFGSPSLSTQDDSSANAQNATNFIALLSARSINLIISVEFLLDRPGMYRVHLFQRATAPMVNRTRLLVSFEQFA
jgi:hypothetical protein